MGRLLRGKKLIPALITLSLIFSFNVVADSNTPPTKPVLIGVNSGKINTTYTFTALSTDLDEDQIKYAFSFGDDSELVFSDFLTSGTSYTAPHSWSHAGLYKVNVNVKDSQNSFSDTTELTILINAKFCGFLGYIIDFDNDEIYDNFYSNSSGEIVSIERFDIYLIDVDNDGEYDYRYNTSTGDIQSFTSGDNTEDNVQHGFDYVLWMPLTFLVILVCIVSLFFVLTFKTKKSNDKENKTATSLYYLKDKKEVDEEKIVLADNLKKDFDNIVFEKEFETEKPKSLKDIEKYIDGL